MYLLLKCCRAVRVNGLMDFWMVDWWGGGGRINGWAGGFLDGGLLDWGIGGDAGCVLLDA
jgi:hypothetical protein